MKQSIITLICLLMCTTYSHAQDARLVQLQDKTTEITALLSEVAKNGNHKDAIAPLQEFITLLDTTTIYQNPDLNMSKGAITSYKGDMQYDLACCYNRIGDKRNALTELEKAVNNGYYNYNNLLYDNDLASLRTNKKFKALLSIVKERQPYEVLKRSNKYSKESNTDIPAFAYQPKEHPNLQLVREYFQLDTIPGKDNELEHIKNILHFAHDNIRHNGSNRTICEFDAIDIYNYHRATGNGVNCRQLAISLCDMYLALGYKARVVTCLPANPDDYECHVINSVYSQTLDKWLYIDPTMDAWVMDESNNMLSIAEVRERLIDGRPLVLCETANWNHEQQQTKEYYLYEYMAKNLYYFVCKSRSFFNQESIYRSTDNEDIRLIPAGFVNNNFQSAKTTSDPDIFWAKPE